MTNNEGIAPGSDKIQAEGFSFTLSRVVDNADCLVIKLDGYYLHEGGATLTRILDCCLRAGFSIFIFRLDLGRFDPGEFKIAWKKIALNDGRMAFAGIEWRHMEAFKESGLDDILLFAKTVDEAVRLCREAPAFENAKLRDEIDEATGKDPEGLGLSYLRVAEGLVVRVAGVLDGTTMGTFEAKIRKAVELGHSRLVFDLMKVERWGGDKTLLALEGIVRAALRKGGNVALARLREPERKKHEGSGAVRALRIFATIEDALAFVADRGSARF